MKDQMTHYIHTKQALSSESPGNSSHSTADSSFDESVDRESPETKTRDTEVNRASLQCSEGIKNVDFVQKYIQPLCLLIFDKLSKAESAAQYAEATDQLEGGALRSDCQNPD
jgi:hypothetical protein